MKLKGYLSVLIIVVCTYMNSGCAITFSGRHQKVNVQTATPGAKVTFNGDSIGTGSARIRLDKFKVFYEVTAEKEGYKSRNYCMRLNKYSPTLAFMILDLGVVLTAAQIEQEDEKNTTVDHKGTGLGYVFAVPTFGLIALRDLRHPKTHRFDKKQTIPALVPYNTRNIDEKYLLINKTAVDIKAKDAVVLAYKGYKKYLRNRPRSEYIGSGKRRALSSEDIKVDNTEFTYTLNKTLKKMNFVDTTNAVFPNVDNAIYVDATIKTVTFHEVVTPHVIPSDKSSKRPSVAFCAELSIDWDVFDFFKQKITTIRTVEKSDMFCITSTDNTQDINAITYKALEDNMEYSIISMRANLEEKGLLKISKTVDTTMAILIDRPQSPSGRIEDFYKSSVGIKTEEGFGNGLTISGDGYIIANYHLVAGAKKIEVIFNDSTRMEAEMVRKNTAADMALLKVKKTGLKAFVLSEDADPEIGSDVWVVGMAQEKGLGQSVSKGIISGVRKTNGMTMLQTDASLNSANGGSALVQKDGKAIGVISMKLMGRGVEGIGFALLAKDVMEKLGLKYK